MSTLSVAPYFPFRRIRIVDQVVRCKGTEPHLDVVPDKRFRPICHRCGARGIHTHSWTQGTVRDLDLAAACVWLRCWYPKILCAQCHRIVIEDLGVFQPYVRVTVRLARYIHELCKLMTVREVAEHLELDWKTVKEIDKLFLEKEYGETGYEGLRIVAIDEISIRKGHRYLTVVLSYESGRVVWSGKQRKALEAIVMDRWDPSSKAVGKKVPHVKIVFHLFHVVAQFNRLIDTVRTSEYRKASQ